MLDQDTLKQSAFMDIQQQAAAASLGMQHHQAYSSLRSSYGTANQQSAHDAFGGQQRNSLAGAYPFAMSNSPLHNSYSHPGSHPYLGSYAPPPPNVNSCAPCPSPPREIKSEPSKFPLICNTINNDSLVSSNDRLCFHMFMYIEIYAMLD